VVANEVKRAEKWGEARGKPMRALGWSSGIQVERMMGVYARNRCRSPHLATISKTCYLAESMRKSVSVPRAEDLSVGRKELERVTRETEIQRRSAERRKRIVANRAANFDEAEKWDLDFWQGQSPEMRLSALVAIRRDVRRVEEGRTNRASRLDSEMPFE
jgi:hypothetical protein